MLVRSVNLMPCDIPQHNYNAVAVLVEEARKKLQEKLLNKLS